MNKDNNNSHKKKYEPDSVMILDEYSFPSESKGTEGKSTNSSAVHKDNKSVPGKTNNSDVKEEKTHSKHDLFHRFKKRNHGFKDLPLPVIMTVCSVAVLVVVVAVTLVSNASLVGGLENEATQAQNSSSAVSGELGADFSDTSEIDDKDDEELLTVEEGDLNPNIEIPPSGIRDENGNYLIEVIKNNDGSVSGAFYRTYEDGKLKLEKEYSSSASLVSITEYLTSGKRVYTVVLDEKGSFNGYNAEEYDENDVLFKKSVFTYGGALSGYYLYQYNQDGTLQREDNFSSFDTLINYTIYKYDTNGNNTERLQYDQNDNLGYRDLLTYDSENRVVKEENYIRDICKTYTEYFYDENGKVESHSYLLVDEYEMKYQKIS